MAVLAVAFVVLAAVPVALTDSEGASSASNVKATAASITADGFYIVDNETSISITSTLTDVKILLPAEKRLAITQGTAKIYYTSETYSSTKTSYTYDADTMIMVTGGTDLGSIAVASDKVSYELTKGTSAYYTLVNGAQYGLTAGTGTAVVYPLAKFTGSAFVVADAYTLTIVISGAAYGTADSALTKVTRSVANLGTNATAVASLSLTQAKAASSSNAASTANKKMTIANASGTLTADYSWNGSVTPTTGSITKGTNATLSTTQLAPGFMLSGSTSVITAPASQAITGDVTHKINAGTSLTSAIFFGSATSGSITKYVEFSDDFVAKSDITMVFDVDTSITLSTGDTTGSVASWAGKITFENLKPVIISSSASIGSLKTTDSVGLSIGAGATLYVWGDIESTGRITNASAGGITIKADADIGDVYMADMALAVSAGVKASANMYSQGSSGVLEYVLSDLEAGDSGFSITAAALAGSYTTGTLTLNAASTVANDISFGNVNIYASMTGTDGKVLTFNGSTTISKSSAGGAVTLGMGKMVFLNDVTVEKYGKINSKAIVVGINSVVTLKKYDSNGATMTNSSSETSTLDVLGKVVGGGQGIITGKENSHKMTVAVGARGSITEGMLGNYTQVAEYLPYYVLDVSADNELKDIVSEIEEIMDEQGFTRFFMDNGVALDAAPSNKSVELPSGIELYLGTVSGGTTINTAASLDIEQAAGTETAITVTVPKSTKLFIKGADAITVQKGNTFIVEGYLMSDDDSTTVSGQGTFELVSGGAVQGTISIETASATGYVEDAHIEGKTSGDLSFPLYQKVIIDEGKTFTISALNTVEIYGTLEIKGTLVIEDNGKLVLGLGSDATAVQGATVTIDGVMNIKKGAVVTVPNASMTVNGSAVVAGELQVSGSVAASQSITNVGSTSKLTLKGTMTVEPTGVLSTSAEKGTVEVSSAGVLDINGYMGSSASVSSGSGPTATPCGFLVIKNSGLVIIDNSSIAARSVGYTAEIVIASAGADVTIDSMLIENGSSDQLTITDADLQVGKSGSTKFKVGSTASTTNTISFSGQKAGKLTGQIVISEVIGSENKDSVTTYSNIMTVSGSVSNGTAIPSGSTELSTAITMQMSYAGTAYTAVATGTTGYSMVGYIQIPEDSDLVVGKDIVVSNTGSLEVAGYLDMTATGIEVPTNSGLIEVSGEIKINKVDLTNTGRINAAKFSVKEGASSSAVTYNVYETLNPAVVDIMDDSNTNTEKAISILGNIVILEDMTIPEDVKVSFSSTSATNSTLTVGSTDDNTVLLTVAQGGSLSSGSGQVIVKGTLKFDDKTNDDTRKTVADVTISDSAENGSITYTNIYNALSTAKSGETVNVTLSADGDAYVELYSSITIGEGVTLVVGSSAAPLYLKNGVTLYVNGTLKTEKDIFAEKQFSTAAKNSEVAGYSSAVIVAGQIQTTQTIIYGDSAAVSSGKDSMAAGAPVYGAYYEIDGYKVISSMAVAQDNLAKIKTSTITVYGPVSAGDLSFSKTSSTSVTSIVVAADKITSSGSTSKDVASSLTVTSLTLDEVTLKVSKDGSFTGTVQNDSAAIAATKIGSSVSDGFQVFDKDGKLVMTKTADAVKGSALSISKGTVYAGETSNAFAFTRTSGTASLSVASGATLEAVNATIPYLNVSGTLAVKTGESLVGGNLTLSGTVDIFAGDDSNAKATVSFTGTVYIGTSSSSVIKSTGAAAVFNGPATMSGAIIVAAGSSVDEDALSSFGTKTTEYYVEDALWITVYDKTSDNSTKITAYNNVAITNGYFSGWNNSKGTAVSSTAVIGSADKVYAGATYEIYQIIIKADQGIGDLYLGGNIMQKGTISDGTYQYYAYWATVKAGTYEVTCKLANGYSGTAVLKDSTGKDLSGNKLTVSGNPDNKSLITENFQLTGIEKSGYVQPTEEKKDSGLTVTDYLLIVLVILVVILAVIVALRLMRS